MSLVLRYMTVPDRTMFFGDRLNHPIEVTVVGDREFHLLPALRLSRVSFLELSYEDIRGKREPVRHRLPIS